MLADWNARIAEFDPVKDLADRAQRHHEWVKRMTDQGRDIPADRVVPTDLRPGPVADRNRPGNCYNGLIAPLEGLAVTGAIWHQGYNNCFKGTEGARMYEHAFPAMITAWRNAFGDPEMAFGIITLCTQGKAQTRDDFTQQMLDAGPYIREAQYKTFLKFLQAGDENVGLVSTYDLRRRWYHPQLKIPAGERAARWALATQYGMGNIPWKPPILEQMTVEDGRIVLKMDANVGAVDMDLPIEGFAIAGEDRRFHPAEAAHLVIGKDDRGRDRRDMKALVLTSPMVPKPVHFRYAWARSPMGNLQAHHNTDIPFATQRSDDWPMEQTPIIEFSEEFTGNLSRGQRGELLRALRAEDLRRRVAEARALLEEHSEGPAE
jgi:sialate O-acetylesterase